jgi:phosphate transport system substrate-binding protein
MHVQRILQSFLLFIAILVFGLTPALSEEEQTIQIKGSDTMVNLGQAWAEAFMEEHPKALIAITGGGSGTGIAALINGTCDIAQSSREIKEQELQLIRKGGREVSEFKTAIDGLAVIVHPSNPVRRLTIDQLSDIFTGKLADWKDFGGKDGKILILSRERNSGTHVYFLEHVLRKGMEKGPEEFAAHVLMLPSSQSIAEEVAQSPESIGYLGIGYVNERHKMIAVSKSDEGPFVLPSVQAAQSGDYPISRPLLMYTGGVPKGLVELFIDFVLSKKGQDIVLEMDFVPLPDAA